MNDIYVTLTGNVAAEPRQHTFPDGSRVTSLRVATTNRYFDKKVQEWRDGERTYFAVRCWRGLADNVAQSVRIGHPVVVQGRLRIREFGAEGERRFMAEVEATAVGHDLRWGTGSFSKPMRGASAPSLDAETRERLDRETEDWAFTTVRVPLTPVTTAATTESAPAAGDSGQVGAGEPAVVDAELVVAGRPGADEATAAGEDVRVEAAEEHDGQEATGDAGSPDEEERADAGSGSETAVSEAPARPRRRTSRSRPLPTTGSDWPAETPVAA